MTTDHTYHAGIELRSDRLTAAAVHLYLHSALNFCTDLTSTGARDECVRLEALRHPSMFSTGERVLWDALGILSAREDNADYAGVIDVDSPHLDGPNRTALVNAVQMWEGAR